MAIKLMAVTKVFLIIENAMASALLFSYKQLIKGEIWRVYGFHL